MLHRVEPGQCKEPQTISLSIFFGEWKGRTYLIRMVRNHYDRVPRLKSGQLSASMQKMVSIVASYHQMF